MGEIWQCVVVLWGALRAAILPRYALRDLPAMLARFLAHLGRCTPTTRERRVDRFLRILGGEDG